MIAVPVVTPRLVIDALERADASVVAVYRSDAEVARYQGWAVPFTLERAEALAASGQLALREDGRLVGDAMVAPVPGGDHAAELGITLDAAAQGRGLAAEAVTALVDAVFASGRLKVIAYVDTRNVASLALFDRRGFRREGHLHHSFVDADGPTDEILFGLTADQWRRPTSSLTVDFAPHPADLGVLEYRLYEYNVDAVGVADGTELAVFDRDELGRIAGGASGVAWAGAAELRMLWVHPRRRGTGLGQRLVAAFEEGARSRGAATVFVGTHSFQAPAFYQKLGYEVTGSWDGFPLGHRHLFLRKML